MIPAPDFPTGGIIYGKAGVIQGYKTGKGRVLIRAKTKIEQVQRGKGKKPLLLKSFHFRSTKKHYLKKLQN